MYASSSSAPRLTASSFPASSLSGSFIHTALGLLFPFHPSDHATWNYTSEKRGTVKEGKRHPVPAKPPQEKRHTKPPFDVLQTPTCTQVDGCLTLIASPICRSLTQDFPVMPTALGDDAPDACQNTAKLLGTVAESGKDAQSGLRNKCRVCLIGGRAAVLVAGVFSPLFLPLAFDSSGCCRSAS